jgi:hypothetical protein
MLRSECCGVKYRARKEGHRYNAEGAEARSERFKHLGKSQVVSEHIQNAERTGVRNGQLQERKRFNNISQRDSKRERF